ncbi:MAG: hypothetical protein K6F92_09505 [Lachnospiraceae bacterium]|nr:hypothetical protein [Lachnospiraceae bacterium]
MRREPEPPRGPEGHDGHEKHRRPRRRGGCLPWILVFILLAILIFVLLMHFGVLNFGGFGGNEGDKGGNTSTSSTTAASENNSTTTEAGDTTVETTVSGTVVTILAVGDEYYIKGVPKTIDDIKKVLADTKDDTSYVIQKNFPSEKSLDALKAAFVEANISFTETD